MPRLKSVALLAATIFLGPLNIADAESPDAATALAQLEQAAQTAGPMELERQAAASGQWADGTKADGAVSATAGSIKTADLSMGRPDRGASRAEPGHGTIWDGDGFEGRPAPDRIGRIIYSGLLLAGLGLVALALAVPAQGPLGIMGVFAAAIGFGGLISTI